MLIHRQNSYTASGAPVAVKRRAVQQINKVKILPVLSDMMQSVMMLSCNFSHCLDILNMSGFQG
jgi:hypothetical protein